MDPNMMGVWFSRRINFNDNMIRFSVVGRSGRWFMFWKQVLSLKKISGELMVVRFTTFVAKILLKDATKTMSVIFHAFLAIHVNSIISSNFWMTINVVVTYRWKSMSANDKLRLNWQL